MNSDKITEKIMYEVAQKERSELFSSIFLLGPAITALFIVAVFCSYKSVASLQQKGFFSLLVEFEYEVNSLLPQLSMLGKEFWQEFEKGYVFVSASSGGAVIFLYKKSKLDNIGTRVKELSKYLPEKNLSILKFYK